MYLRIHILELQTSDYKFIEYIISNYSFRDRRIPLNSNTENSVAKKQLSSINRHQLRCDLLVMVDEKHLWLRPIRR